MIRHIVFFSAKNPEDREAIFNGLSVLKDIKEVKNFEIGRNVKKDILTSAEPDFVVYGEFENEAQLEAYKGHPLYAKSISIVRPLRDMRIAADFVNEL